MRMGIEHPAGCFRHSGATLRCLRPMDGAVNSKTIIQCIADRPLQHMQTHTSEDADRRCEDGFRFLVDPKAGVGIVPPLQHRSRHRVGKHTATASGRFLTKQDTRYGERCIPVSMRGGAEPLIFPLFFRLRQHFAIARRWPAVPAGLDVDRLSPITLLTNYTCGRG